MQARPEGSATPTPIQPHLGIKLGGAQQQRRKLAEAGRHKLQERRLLKLPAGGKRMVVIRRSCLMALRTESGARGEHCCHPRHNKPPSARPGAHQSSTSARSVATAASCIATSSSSPSATTRVRYTAGRSSFFRRGAQ